MFTLLSLAFSLQAHTSPPKTTSIADAEQGPLPTEPPLLEKREDYQYVPPNICGWYSGSGYGVSAADTCNNVANIADYQTPDGLITTPR